MTEMAESIGREIMRQAMLEALRRGHPNQYLTYQSQTAEILQKRNLPVSDGMHGSPPALRPQDQRRFREILWSLVNEGILVQGMNESNPNWPWLSLTEWGEEYMSSDTAADIYDPEGYLRALGDSEPLDDVEIRFLGQAIRAFRAGLPDACAVMLGAASEHLLIKLGQAIANSELTRTGSPSKNLPTRTLILLKYLRGYLAARKDSLPRELQEDIETTFLGVGAIIRSTRNDSGHPRGGTTTREQAAVNLQIFPNYRRWVTTVIRNLPLTEP